MKLISKLFLGMCLCSCGVQNDAADNVASALASAESRPNILFILTDDQGYADLGSFGATDLETPNIDALANDGVKLTQFYAGAPVCSPSRASLLTGQTPQRAGVPTNVSSNVAVDGMPASEITLAEALSAEGYATGLIGKWHLGVSPSTVPTSQGFDFAFGHLNGCIDNYSHTYYWEEPYKHDLFLNNKPIRRDGLYFPDLMVLEAKRFIDLAGDKPFFAYFAMNLPHYPYQGDADWLEHYREKGLSSPRLEYSAFVSTLDERVGDLISHLKATGKYDNTIIIFQSDHGFSTESRAMGGGGSAGIYRGAKLSLFEGGIRIPAIIKYDGLGVRNQTREQLAVAADWFPTLLDILNIDRASYDFDGKSILPFLENEDQPSPHESFVWEFDGSTAIRRGDWKLLLNPRDTSVSTISPSMKGAYLYNLRDDPSEQNNLADSNADRVDAMAELGISMLRDQAEAEACSQTERPSSYSISNPDAFKKIVRDGWYGLEPNLIWSSDRARLNVPIPETCAEVGCVTKLRAGALGVMLNSSELNLSFEINGQHVEPISFSDGEVILPMPQKCVAEIVIKAPGATRPSDISLSKDTRLLGISLQQISIMEMSR